jgi:hypothetical protein
MSRRRSLPSYRLHKQSGQAVVTLPDGLGGLCQAAFLRALEALQRQRRHAAVIVRRARHVNVANGPQVNVAG